MTTTEIRAEIAELINGGKLKLAPIVAFFKQNRPTANIDTVKAEAKELIAQTKAAIKGTM